MAEANENEGIVIDVAPEQEPDPAPPSEPPAAAADEKSSYGAARPRRFGWALSAGLGILAIALVGVSLFIGYPYVRTLKAEIVALDNRLGAAVKAQNTLQSAVDLANETVQSQSRLLAAQESQLHVALSEQRQITRDQTESIKENVQQLTEERRLMEEREAELRTAIADVHRRMGGSGHQWKVAEAQYLIRLAGHRLSLSRDVQTAREALRLANHRLRDTHDAGWQGIREQIEHDIAALSAVTLPDDERLTTQLQGLLDQVPKLTPSGSGRLLATDNAHQATPEAPTAPVQDTPRETSFSGLWHDMLDGLKNSVRIRRNVQSQRKLLTPEHALFVRQNVVLNLETARLGLVRKDVRLYQSSLASTRGWLQQYFDIEDPATQKFLASLAKLSAVDIRPDLPDLSRSLRDLDARMRSLEANSVSSSDGVDRATEVKK